MGVDVMFALVFVLAVAQKVPAGRAQVPDAQEQKAAEKEVRALYANGYKSVEPADRRALAARLLEDAAQSKEGTAIRFVMLREAKDVAAGAGEARTALEAARRMGREFEIDAMEAGLDALKAASRAAKTKIGQWAVGRAFVELAEDAVAADDYKAARSALSAASSVGKASGDAALAKAMAKRLKEVSEIEGAFPKASKATEVMRASPDDPEANLTAGRFLCLMNGDWKAGLPLLAKGSDPTLAMIGKDAPEVEGPEQMAAMGGRLYGLAAKEKGVAKRNLRAYAAKWYGKAVGGLSGLAKAEAQKRIEEVRSDNGIGISPADWRLMLYEDGAWKFSELDEKVAAVRGDEMTLSGSWQSPSGSGKLANVALVLKGSFSARAEVKGVATVEIADTTGADRGLAVDVPQDGRWHEVILERAGGKVSATIDGKGVEVKPYGAANIDGHFCAKVSKGGEGAVRGFWATVP